MNSRERLRRCFYNEEIDRPGIYVRTGYPRNDPTYDRLKEYINTRTDLKIEYFFTWDHSDDLLEYKVEPRDEDFEKHTVTFHTPTGDIQSVSLQGLRGKSGMRTEQFLKNREDAEKWLSLPVPAPGLDLTGYFQADKDMGDRGIVMARIRGNPAGHVAGLFGSELFALMSLTDRDLIHELCQRQLDITLGRVKYLIEQGAGPYFTMLGEEMIVPPLHGPDDFYDFNVRYDKPIIELVHEAGGRMHIHSHGPIKKVFQGFIDMGADVLHPFEPPPMGDITAAEAKEMARDKLCLEGNIQIATMYESTADAIRAEIEALIADAFDDNKGLIVCPSASPYMHGLGEDCYENFKAMVDAVLAYNG